MALANAERRLSPEELLTASARLATAELERLVLELLVLRAQRLAPSLPQREAELLLEINQGLPPAQQARYHELMAKRRALQLTPAESDELLQLTDEAESREAERIEQLSELARLRGTSLRSLMADLRIRPADHG